MSWIGKKKYKFQIYFGYIKNEIALRKNVWKPHMMSMEKTMQEIEEKKLSVSRFGDGEFKWMLNMPQDSFQTQSEELRNALIKTLNTNDPRLLLCTTDCFDELNQYKRDVKWFWGYIMSRERDKLEKIFPRNYEFGNLNVTRFYIDYKNTNHVKTLIEMWKKIWNDKDILIVEGCYTRLGVGNDLFDNVKSIQRILAPAKNAFDYYDDILKKTIKYSDGKDMVLLALGPTATVMAADLALHEIRAIDIGHIDIEYEWYRMKAKTKVAVPSKYVNEAANCGGRDVDDIKSKKEQEKYMRQVVERIGNE